LQRPGLDASEHCLSALVTLTQPRAALRGCTVWLDARASGALLYFWLPKRTCATGMGKADACTDRQLALPKAAPPTTSFNRQAFDPATN